jgi:membrane protein implicated in regulation of membrane protease activity
MDGWYDSLWLIWLAVALGAGVIEMLSLDFFFVMVAGGALSASVAAGIGLPFPLQVIVFAIATGALLITARPPLVRWAHSNPATTTNAAALVGREALVLEAVDDRTGRVKLAGEVWTARVPPGAPPLEVGSAVQVVRIDGATAVVAPHQPLGPNSLEGSP